MGAARRNRQSAFSDSEEFMVTDGADVANTTRGVQGYGVDDEYMLTDGTDPAVAAAAAHRNRQSAFSNGEEYMVTDGADVATISRSAKGYADIIDETTTTI